MIKSMPKYGMLCLSICTVCFFMLSVLNPFWGTSCFLVTLQMFYCITEFREMDEIYRISKIKDTCCKVFSRSLVVYVKIDWLYQVLKADSLPKELPRPDSYRYPVDSTEALVKHRNKFYNVKLRIGHRDPLYFYVVGNPKSGNQSLEFDETEKMKYLQLLKSWLPDEV